jgi:hypothetical protein
MAWRPLELVVTPATTYILLGSDDHYRRIFTDGRDWPTEIEPTFSGYSIGRWIDEDGDGRYDVLEAAACGRALKRESASGLIGRAYAREGCCGVRVISSPRDSLSSTLGMSMNGYLGSCSQ